MISHGKKRHTVTLPIPLIRELRVYAFVARVHTGRVIEMALKEYIDNHPIE